MNGAPATLMSVEIVITITDFSVGRIDSGIFNLIQKVTLPITLCSVPPKQQDKILPSLLCLPCVLNIPLPVPLTNYLCKTLWRLLLPFCSRMNCPCKLSILIVLVQEDHCNFPSK